MTITGFESFAAILIWMIPFCLGRHLRLGASMGRRSLISAAGGISVAYVFVDILPTMAQMQELFDNVSIGYPYPFPAYRVYTSALVGFIGFYSLEHMVVLSRPGRRTEAEEGGSFIGWIHIIGFAFYAALVGYLLQSEEQGPSSFVLYVLAMFLHFLLVDHSLRQEHKGFYDSFGRWVIAFAVMAGWTVGIAGITSDFVLPTLMGFLGGGVVVNSIKEELPEKGEGRVLPFVLGAFGYALLLLLIGSLEGSDMG
jgi:zinc transporter ZupT